MCGQQNATRGEEQNYPIEPLAKTSMILTGAADDRW